MDDSACCHLAAGLSVGLCGIAAGYSIGKVGDSGVRAFMDEPRVYVGMVLILIFGEVLGLYGCVLNHVPNHEHNSVQELTFAASSSASSSTPKPRARSTTRAPNPPSTAGSPTTTTTTTPSPASTTPGPGLAPGYASPAWRPSSGGGSSALASRSNSRQWMHGGNGFICLNRRHSDGGLDLQLFFFFGLRYVPPPFCGSEGLEQRWVNARGEDTQGMNRVLFLLREGLVIILTRSGNPVATCNDSSRNGKREGKSFTCYPNSKTPTMNQEKPSRN